MKAQVRKNRATMVRLLVVAASVIAVGALLYGTAVFTQTMRPFQFALSGVTAAIAYAFFRTHDYRTGMTVLFGWYVIITGLMTEFHRWLLILDLAYVAGIAGAVAVFLRFREHPVIPGPILRVILAGTIISLANGIIILFLTLFSPQVVMNDLDRWGMIVTGNLEMGAVIGIAAGIGFELSDAVIGRWLR